MRLDKDMIKLSHCKVEVIRHEEDFSTIEESFDEDVAIEVRKDYESGNYWAFCDIEVMVSFDNYSVSKFLGCANYKDEADFRNDPYFQDMQQEAFDELLPILVAARDKLNQALSSVAA